MKQLVTVTEIDGEYATVRGRRASACGSCAGKASCSTLGSWRERVLDLRVKNHIGASIGDEVLLEVSDSLLLRVACYIYAIPMVVFVATGTFVSLLAGEMAWPMPEVLAAVAALLSVPVTYLFVVRRKKAEAALDVRMLRVTPHHECSV